MKSSVLSTCKAAVVAAVVLAIPVFAVYGLFASPAGRPVALAEGHDPLVNISNMVEQPAYTRTQLRSNPKQEAAEVVNPSTWDFTFLPPRQPRDPHQN